MSNWIYVYNQPIFNYNLLLIEEKFYLLYSKSIDWIFLTFDSETIITFKIWYDNISNQFDVFSTLWYFLNQNDKLHIFNSFYIDLYNNLNIIDNIYNCSWNRFFLNTKDSNLILIYHPELIFFPQSLDSYFNYILTNENFKLYNTLIPELNIIACTLWIHIFISIFISSIFISFLFSTYNNINKDEKLVDNEFLNISILIESEKEITSIDDCLVLLASIIFIFGFYFYTHSLIMFNNISIMILMYYSLFIVFLFILGIPTLLLYDLGIYFLLYLKGAGKSYNFFIEIIYDYIACIVFYTRIFAQWIRLVLMLVTYLSMSHYVAEFEILNNNILLNDNKTNKLNNLNYNNSSISYYIISIIPIKIIYWCYEILHTLFLVTSQFVAFFAIVFWLILFLYTFFVSEKFEEFFNYRRKLREKYNKRINQLKN